MTPLRVYAIARLSFGVAALALPAISGRALSGAGGAEPDAQAFLRGMGGRELGIALGLLAASNSAGLPRSWVIAGMLADSADLAGIAGSWTHIPPAKRWSGAAMAGVALASGAGLLAHLSA